MFCNKCGNQLSENAKFCWSCGASIEPAAAAPMADEVIAPQTPVEEIPVIQETPVEPVIYEQSVWSAPVEPAVQPKKPRKKWIPFAVLGGAVAAVAAIVLTLFLNGFFDSDAVRLYKALTKSSKAFAEAGEALSMPDLQYIQDEKAYSAEFSFVLNEVQGNEELRGLGISGALDCNLPNEKLDMILTPSYGSVDLMNVQVKLHDNMLYLGAPEITGNTFYSFNTETIFGDLSKLGADVEGMENVRINVFELLQILSEDTMFTKEAQEKITKAVENLIRSMEVEKVGAEEITVNGYDLKCDEYTVVITKEAVLDYYKAILEIMTTTDMTDLVIKLCESLNIPEEKMNLTTSEIDTDEILASLKEALDEYGDIELTVYLKDGYMMAVVFDINFEDSPLKCELNIGGGENYVDDLSISFTADGQTILLKSTGNHAGKNGKFTDETKLSMKADGFSMTILTAKLSFDSTKNSDNFQWTMKVPTITINVSGNISYDSKSMAVDLDDISFTQSGQEVLAYSMYYAVGEYTESVQVENAVELLKLSEDEIIAETTALGESIEQWAMGMADQIPELLALFM